MTILVQNIEMYVQHCIDTKKNLLSELNWNQILAVSWTQYNYVFWIWNASRY